MRVDVLIVGAGLAGACCGMLLQRRGLSVLAVDHADLQAKDKLCGGMLTPRALELVDQLYGERAQGLFAQDFGFMDVRCGQHQIDVPGLRLRSLRRQDLDRFAVERFLEAGGQLADRTRVVELDAVGCTALLRTPYGDLDVEFGELVAADGANSWVRRTLTGRRPVVVPSLEAPVAPSGAPLVCRYDADLQGYGWYIPCGERACIGIDGAPGTAPAKLREGLEAFAAEVGVALDSSAVRGACIPVGNDLCLEAAGAYFVGDAAGLACPATGEGIYFALKSAQALADHLAGEKPYEQAMAPLMLQLRRQHAMLPLLFDERVMEGTLALARGMKIGEPAMARFAFKLFASF
ncbi:MAG: FAD-dependent monooxygenase [Coriobacteriia bacterium]|nr:FAD-dependent monooxygenase [Coriobacteriia bacterium]